MNKEKTTMPNSRELEYYEARRRITLIKRKLGGLGFLIRRNNHSVPLITNVVKGGEAEARGVEVGYLIETGGLSYGQIVDKLARVPVGKPVTISFKTVVKMKTSAIPKGREANSTNGLENGTAVMPKASNENYNGLQRNENHFQQNGNYLNGSANGIESSEIHHQPKHDKKYVKLLNWINNTENIDTLHSKSEDAFCTKKICEGSIMQPGVRPYGQLRPKQEMKKDAAEFLKEYYKSIKKDGTPDEENRIENVMREIDERGTYELELTELIFGAKTAWRNSLRCIGRIQWNKLQVFDARDITTARGMFDMICKHMRFGTNKGNIRSAITIFPQRKENMKDFRIWNSQLIKYAGYKQADGRVIGDPGSVELTQICQSLGWKGEGGRFDVLPLVLQASGQDPELFVIPPDLVMQVDITHPKYSWFEDLGLKWYCLPAVSNMLLDVGGVEFPCVPFNGWYMSTEIGARNFGDTARYNMLKPVATKMGLNTRTNSSLWKDQALVELNIAVLHSFNAAGATIVDHHTASESFMKHLENEQKLRGGCPADWVWIIPPLSGSACPVFHQEMLSYILKPLFDYQEDPFKYFPIDKAVNGGKKRFGFKEVAKAVKLTAKLMGEAMAKRHKAIILYATETGKSENYARILGDLFSHAFDPKVICMADFNLPELEYEQLVLIVTSTFGNGEAPTNGEKFGEMLYKLKHPQTKSANTEQRRLSNIHIQKYGSNERVGGDQSEPLANLRFSVFGLGSRAYPHFCAFAHSCRNLVIGLGGEEIFPIGEGDELCGQEESFMSWAKDVFKAACETFCIEFPMKKAVDNLTVSSNSWKKGKFRYFVEESKEAVDHFQGLQTVHNKDIATAKVISKQKLQHPDSSRSTILLSMSIEGQKNMRYEPGDHLAVFPENKPGLVNKLITQLVEAPNPDLPIRMEICKEMSGPFGPIQKWETLKRLPLPCTLRDALTRYLDITSPPTPQFLTQLAMLAADPKERQRLEELGKGSSTYEDWKFYRFPNIVEVIEEFPSLEVDVLLILTQLPLLQSRYYSISSSPLLYPNQVHITVAVVKYKTQGGNGPEHYGVCSTWLDSLGAGDMVPVRIRSAPSFHLPDDQYLPVLMIGPGTGIAPFRAFWQHRLYQLSNGKMKEDLGPLQLYFGCRTSKLDFIYQDELVKMQKEGVLEGLHIALSREPMQPKRYVQDVIRQNSEQVCELILLNGGHIYVCGDVSMASDVSKTLLNLFQEFAALSQIEAQELIAMLRSSGRYHEDIFGVTLRTAEVTDRVRSAAKKAWSFASGSSETGKVTSARKYSLSFIEGLANMDRSAKKNLSQQENIEEEGETNKLGLTKGQKPGTTS